MRSLLLIVPLWLAVLAPSGCERAASSRVPATATTTVISMQAIDCQSCGTTAIEALKRRPGVYTATFDRVRAELTIEHDAQQIDGDQLLAAVHEAGFEAVAGAGHGAYIPEVEFDAGLDVAVIAHGDDRVRLDDHLTEGKVTVFDFYAAWCKPCRQIDHHMKGVLAEQPDVALRKLDVVDWDSAVARDHLAGASELPFLVVYGRSGRKVAQISGLRLDELDAAIAEARQR